MRRISKIAAATLLVALPLLIWLNRARNPERVESRDLPRSQVLLAATGRVEGRDRTISLGAAADGIVKEVLVTDGQKVKQGDLLAVIDCDDISAEVGLARAQVDSARDARTRLLRGHRDEERQAAARDTEAAQAVMTQAEEHLKRMKALYQSAEISRDLFEQTQRDFEVAQANYQRALDEQNLVNAKPLPEEIASANAAVAAAERNVSVATDKLEKCNVRAPISGTVLKVMTKVGESYSTLLPHPLFTLADDSVRRVRAEIDERDIARVKLGQVSIVTSDAFPGQRFEGEVIHISDAMETKSVLSEDPSQEVDRDILDVIIELKKSGADLPIGLRVTAQMTAATMPVPQSSAPSANATNGQALSQRTVASAAAATVLSQKAVVPAPAAPAKLGGFVLQVGAMTHRENADALVASLRGKNFPAFVLARDGDRFYRVDVGPYPDVANARIAKNELKDGGFGAAIELQLRDDTH
jgi:HlyD family secretion protein